MPENKQKNTVEISLTENKTYIVKQGEIEAVDSLPDGYGKQIITWQGGKPVHTEISYSKLTFEEK
ncbi:DUF3954 domain-containing protein [Salipaludibacillus sp. HK11]|uniref:DUF3954 domain-containing protein n=1 Tax=Salipaludibacillus sp. HK11 TaxID=3394320 RepID=UPI0039FC4B60